jgi:hypothetical protein
MATLTNELVAKYKQYLETANLSVLDLKDEANAIV